MKTKCNLCTNDLKKQISSSFESYQVGKIKCSSCNKTNERYISESDLLMYFGLSCVLYTSAFLAITFLFNLLSTLPSIAVYISIFIVLIGMYFITKNIAYFIYDKAPLKNSWKTIQLEEDAKDISKRMKGQFILFMLVAIMFGSQPQYVVYCFTLLIAIIILVCIKVKLSLRNEKIQIAKKKK